MVRVVDRLWCVCCLCVN